MDDKDPRSYLATYADFPDPLPGSDDHGEWLEQVKADLTGITGDDPAEQAFMAPISPFVPLLQFYLAGFVILWMAADFPTLSLILGWSLFLLSLWILDGRPIGQGELGTPRLMQNLIVRKRGGRRLLIITASIAASYGEDIDSQDRSLKPGAAPAFLRRRPVSGETLRLIKLVSGGLSPIFLSLGVWLLDPFITVAAISLGVSAAACLHDHRAAISGRFYADPRRSADVAAAVALAQRLVEDQPVDTEILLVLTDGGWNPLSGWRTMLQDRGDAIDDRPLTVIGFKGLGVGALGIIREGGAALPRSYTGPLARQAGRAAKESAIPLALTDHPTSDLWVHPLTGRGGDFLLLTGVAEGSSAPPDHSALDFDQVNQAVYLAEKAVRARLGA